MFHYDYKTENTCSQVISLDLDGNTVHNVRFMGGCNGNLQGISSLVKDMPIDEVIKRLDGIDCGGKGTSCPAQLANALKEYRAQV